jgi:hypothetical protein
MQPASQLAKPFGVDCIAWLAILRASFKFGKAWIYNYPRQAILQPSDLAGWKCLGMIQRSDRNFDNIIVRRILQNQWRATTTRKAPDPIRDAYPSKLTTYKTNILTFDGTPRDKRRPRTLATVRAMTVYDTDRRLIKFIPHFTAKASTLDHSIRCLTGRALTLPVRASRNKTKLLDLVGAMSKTRR